MSVRRLAPEQPDHFEFTRENLAWADQTISKYPEGKQASAVVPLLWRAQEQNEGWLTEPAIRKIAEMLDMAAIRVLEVSTFYSMFNLSPVGKYFVQLCGTTPCWLRGVDDLKKVCQTVIGPEKEVTENGLWSWAEVECLGACVNAPMVQINKDYFEDLDAENFEKLLNDLRDGKAVMPGPQNGRQFSCPKGGATSLMDFVEEGYAPEVEATNGLGASGLTGISAEASPSRHEEESGSADEAQKIEGGAQPPALRAALDDRADDLTRIKGIGPKLGETLKGLGIFHFSQIALWTSENVAWIDQFLSFKGRVARERWIEQAEEFVRENNGDHGKDASEDGQEKV